MILGEQLVALRADGRGLFIWDLISNGRSGSPLLNKDLENEMQFHPDFLATTMLHPATYLNKIVIGGRNGQLQLWNTRSWFDFVILLIVAQ
jgi:U3 small nucleolar RNA-associated protein 21